VVKGYADDRIAQELLTSLAVDQTNSKGYSLDNGVIHFKGRVWLGTIGSLRNMWVVTQGVWQLISGSNRCLHGQE
jgi:hypothetical protein